MKELKVLKLHPEAKLPTRAHDTDCGLDVYSLENVLVGPGENEVISTGISAEFLSGYLGLFADRSSMAKKGWKLAGGIIDPGYTGELKVVLQNNSNDILNVDKGDKIAQLLILPILTPKVIEVTKLSESLRGQKGFGSSGS